MEQLFDGQKAGRIKPVQAVEMNNTFGKVLGLLKLQLEDNKLRVHNGDRMNQLPKLLEWEQPSEPAPIQKAIKP